MEGSQKRGSKGRRTLEVVVGWVGAKRARGKESLKVLKKRGVG